jgi:hypothetical protein
LTAGRENAGHGCGVEVCLFEVVSSTVDHRRRSMNRRCNVAFVMLTAIVLGASIGFSRGDAASVHEKGLGPSEVYAEHCSACHGSDGRAKTAKGRKLSATDFTKRDWNADEARGIRIITKGRSEMPSFKDKLSADEIRGVFGYVVAFRQ